MGDRRLNTTLLGIINTLIDYGETHKAEYISNIKEKLDKPGDETKRKTLLEELRNSAVGKGSLSDIFLKPSVGNEKVDAVKLNLRFQGYVEELYNEVKKQLKELES